MLQKSLYPFVCILLLLAGAYHIALSQQELIRPSDEISIYQPLDTLVLSLPDGARYEVRDGIGQLYNSGTNNGIVSIEIGGALGRHSVWVLDKKGRMIDQQSFRVHGQTYLRDRDRTYAQLLQTLLKTMRGEWGRDANVVLYQGKFYHFFVRWLRDHVHTLKGMQYFYPELTSGIDLFAESQREDGMIWDNFMPRNQEKNWWDKRFRYGDFIRDVENGTLEFKRIPIENDVEYLFIEGLYKTWMATGDDKWMQAQLNRALKALHYSLHDPYRWSKPYQLLKRGFTIDTWDFQSNEDAALVGRDIMVVDLQKSRFGIMFGDNTGMAAACRYLGDMLDSADRNAEADSIRKIGSQLQSRIDKLAWNGAYYTHHIPEDRNLKRDLGTDLDSQVSLSNAYSLNRDISHEQAVAIIQTYQRIRDEMPASSPGEWYTIYPPFEYGFGKGDNSTKWEYMNGGVTSIVAGELAKGAFDHGFETYGVDILNRVAALAAKTGNYLHCAYRGAMPALPTTRFQPIDLTKFANISYPGKGARYEGKWIGETQVFAGIPFTIADPDQHAHTSLTLGRREGLKHTIPIGRQATSIYLLHTATPGKYAGHLVLHYKDGTTHSDYMTMDKIGNWWIENDKRKKNIICQKAWRSDNEAYIAYYTYGLANPFPDKEIDSVRFHGTDDGRQWHIAGITLSDDPVFFMPDIVSHGIPDNWGAAAVTYSLIEGLAGAVPAAPAFREARISPRWAAAGVDQVKTLIHFPASEGYVSYDYSASNQHIDLQYTGNGSAFQLRVLLPAGKTVTSLVNDEQQAIPYSIERVEQSQYISWEMNQPGVHHARINLE